jgi:hypothetical protein
MSKNFIFSMIIKRINMKYLIYVLIAIICNISYSQSLTLDKIEFKMTDNGLLTNKIPYGKPFIIYGNILINRYDTASIIQLKIKDVEKKEIIQSLEWNNKSIDKQFEFIIAPLEMDRKLEFSIAVYGPKYSLIEELTNNTLVSVKDFFSSNSFVNESDVDSIFKSEYAKLINNGAKIGYFKDGEFTLGFPLNIHITSAIHYMKNIFDGDNTITKLTQIQLKEIKPLLLNCDVYRASSYTYASTTERESIRFGTSIGTGLSFLSLGNKPQTIMISYTAIKYYIKPIDKSVPSQYYDWKDLNRLSILFGTVISPIKYRGSSLDEVLGIFPVLGLSIDMDKDRFTSLDFGLIMFDQKSLSDVDSKTRFHSAPFISLSIDLNIFNRLSVLIKK